MICDNHCSVILSLVRLVPPAVILLAFLTKTTYQYDYNQDRYRHLLFCSEVLREQCLQQFFRKMCCCNIFQKFPYLGSKSPNTYTLGISRIQLPFMLIEQQRLDQAGVVLGYVSLGCVRLCQLGLELGQVMVEIRQVRLS